jgi:hypothetical protein
MGEGNLLHAAAAPGPQLFPRVHTGQRDELGYPLLADSCPVCSAMALIINEWDAAECLTCSWREFGPDSPRATFRDWEGEEAQRVAEQDGTGPAVEVTAEDAALIRAIAEATFPPGARVTLPSGRTISGAEMQRWITQNGEPDA